MSNVIESLGLTEEVKEIKFGKSFVKGGNTYFHTFRYDFKPASMDPKKMASVDIGEGHQVTVTVPHINKGSGSTHTVFKGSKKSYHKECVIIIDHCTGEAKLEKLDFNVQLKKFRAEGSSKIKPSPVDCNGAPSSKKSPLQRLSPPQKSFWSSNHSSPLSNCSPLPKSPNSQSSPPSQTSPSVPSLVPPPSNSSDSRHFSQVPAQDPSASFAGCSSDNAMSTPEIGVLSSSESSVDSSGSSSSDSESSDEETGASLKLSDLPNGTSHSSKEVNMDSQPVANAVPNMPHFSQLSQDLQLSESDSD